MKTASSQLLALLNARPKQYVFCDLYTFTLQSGLVLRYTTADIDITDGAHTWLASGPYFDKVSTHKGFHAKTGLDVNTWEVQVGVRMIDPVTGAAYPDTIGSVPWLQAIVVGVLDGATAQVDRAYLAQWPQPAIAPVSITNTILTKLFYGFVGQIEVHRTTATITLNDWLDRFSISMPRNYWGGACRFTLFDAGCQLNAASFAVNGTVVVNSPANVIYTHSTPPGATSFTLGRIVFTGGANVGLQKRIISYSAGTGPGGSNNITIDYPFPFAINPGDAFTAYPGCSKSQAACVTFNNLINYGGADYIPVPELGL